MTIMTYEEALAKRTYSDAEVKNLWSAFEGIACPGDADFTGVATPLQRDLITALIKTAPVFFRHDLGGSVELIGYFPQDAMHCVSIHLTQDDEITMMDAQPSDVAFFSKHRVEG